MIDYVSAYICCADESVLSFLDEYLVVVQTLAHCGNVALNVTPPLGCAILTVSDKCQIHLFLKVRTSSNYFARCVE